MKQKQLLSFLVCILMLSSCAAPTDSSLDSGLTLRVYFADAEEIRLLPLEDYVFGALAAEMPANYAPEALKCQAVAARTRAVAQSRAFGGNGCVRHPDCDICTDSACCQAYQTDAQLQARWGSEYAILRARIDRAVRATDGLLLTSGGLPIEVLYHACSGGKTEDAAAVFASAKPYLVSVDSPGEEGVRRLPRRHILLLRGSGRSASARFSRLRRDSGHAAQRDSSAIHDCFRARRDAAGRQSNCPRR